MSGTSRDLNPAGLCYSSAHLVQCEPDEASSFTNPNVSPGTYAGLWLELNSKVYCHTSVSRMSVGTSFQNYFNSIGMCTKNLLKNNREINTLYHIIACKIFVLMRYQPIWVI